MSKYVQWFEHLKISSSFRLSWCSATSSSLILGDPYCMPHEEIFSRHRSFQAFQNITAINIILYIVFRSTNNSVLSPDIRKKWLPMINCHKHVSIKIHTGHFATMHWSIYLEGYEFHLSMLSIEDNICIGKNGGLVYIAFYTHPLSSRGLHP